MAPVHRLSRSQFSAVWQIGARHSSRIGLFIVAPSDQPGLNLAVVVAKKISSKSTARNKLKRQMRSMVTEWSKDKELQQQLVIIVRSQALKMEFLKLKDEVLLALDRMVV